MRLDQFSNPLPLDAKPGTTVTFPVYLSLFVSEYGHDLLVWHVSDTDYRNLPPGNAFKGLAAGAVTFTLPEDYNPSLSVTPVIEAEKAKALEKYQQTVKRLNDQLQKFLAIQNGKAE